MKTVLSDHIVTQGVMFPFEINWYYERSVQSELVWNSGFENFQEIPKSAHGEVRFW